MAILQSNSSQHLQVTQKYGTFTIIFSFIQISKCFNTDIYFQAKTCFSKSGMRVVAIVTMHNPIVQTKLLKISPNLKTDCLVKCLWRNTLITNNSSGFKQSSLLWTSPLILWLRIFLQFHLRLWHFIFGSYLRPKSNHAIIISKSKYSNTLAVMSEKIAILSLCCGLDFLVHNGLDFPHCWRSIWS
jgi:hypothetical protein